MLGPGRSGEERAPLYNADIIFLNGPSSSGKSSLARVLQDRLDQPFVRLDVDDFADMFPERFQGSGERARAGIYHAPDQAKEDEPSLRLGPSGRNFVSGFHHAIRAFVECGNRLIVAHLLLEPVWLEECVELLRDRPVLFVGLHCPLEIVEEREERRGDRTRGFARGHYSFVHRDNAYDLTVDTGRTSSEGCAQLIRSRLIEGPPPWPFGLSRRLAGSAGAGSRP